ncbi:hypothetical protein LCL61_24370 [Amycolatopsis coloradensis]|uniref:Uncharacterized protein n=1 Tax=Amycolatopsis coloradensis TaxID=76021 RepID=A0ACD5BHI6_9PSEU
MTHASTTRPALAPRVEGSLPGPRSAEFLEHQRQWESSARAYPRHLGIELADPSDGRPAGGYARAVQAHALRHGLIVELGGRDDSVIRLMPPLTVTAEEIELACGILLDAIGRCCPAG